MFASRKRVSEVTKPVGFVAGANNPVIAPSLQQAPSADNLQKLEIAKRLASQINAAKNLGGEQDNTQQVAAAILRGDMSTPQISVRLCHVSSLVNDSRFTFTETVSAELCHDCIVCLSVCLCLCLSVPVSVCVVY